MKRFLSVVVSTLSFLLVSCGQGPVKITSPADGQTYQIPRGGNVGSYQQLVVMLDDEDAYEDTTIELVNKEKVPVDLSSCTSQNGYGFVCYIMPARQGQVQGGQPPYVVLIRATRGDYSDTKLIYFQ